MDPGDLPTAYEEPDRVPSPVPRRIYTVTKQIRADGASAGRHAVEGERGATCEIQVFFASETYGDDQSPIVAQVLLDDQGERFLQVEPFSPGVAGLLVARSETAIVAYVQDSLEVVNAQSHSQTGWIGGGNAGRKDEIRATHWAKVEGFNPSGEKPLQARRGWQSFDREFWCYVIQDSVDAFEGAAGDRGLRCGVLVYGDLDKPLATQKIHMTW